MATELELKLSMPSTAASRVLQSRAIAPFKQGRSRSARLLSTYFDTPDQVLAGHGAALRVRSVGRRWIQTLKTGGSSAGGASIRNEFEWPVPGAALDLVVLRESPLATLIPELDLATLKPVFTTDFVRRAQQLRFPDGTLAELAIDQGAILAGNRSVPISEIEIELKDGDVQPLFGLAKELVTDLPLTVGFESKAARGFALASRAPPTPVRGIRPVLETGPSARTAAAAVLIASMAQMQANSAGVLRGRDIEFLHQFRVGTRRLRAALKSFAPVLPPDRVAPIVEELRWLALQIGPARDWDVWTFENLPVIQAQFPSVAGFELLRRRSLRLRRQALVFARTALGSVRYQLLLLNLGLFIAILTQLDRQGAAGPSMEVLIRALLDKRATKLNKRDPRDASVEAKHEARLAAKNLRYAVEAVGALVHAKRARTFAARLGLVQDILGSMNDAAVAARLLDELNAVAPGTPALLEAVGIARGWVAGNAAGKAESLARTWRRYRRATRFW